MYAKILTSKIEIVWDIDEKYIVYGTHDKTYKISIENKMTGLGALFGTEYGSDR